MQTVIYTIQKTILNFFFINLNKTIKNIKRILGEWKR